MKKKDIKSRDLGFNDEFETDEVETKKKKGKKNNKQNVTKSGIIKIPKTVQDTIPYIAVYKNGIIETDPGIFSKSYRIEDVNFKIATDEEQENIFSRYMDLLNTFDSDVHTQLVLYNRNMDAQKVHDRILIPFKRDTLNEYREEYNEMLKHKMMEGRNNITKEKYLTLSISAESVEEAFTKFVKLDIEVSAVIKRINGMETPPMTAVERLEVLADIFSDGSETQSFYQKANINNHDLETFNFSWMTKQGLTTKDLIGPASFKFNWR